MKKFKTILESKLSPSSWPAEIKRDVLVSLILIPPPEGEGGWTEKERMALDLLRFGEPEARSFGRVPTELMELRAKSEQLGGACNVELLKELHAGMANGLLKRGWLREIDLEGV